jgi:lipopolysaccharide/colanic/teichoic acid biosynthesis glycosyltransferase
METKSSENHWIYWLDGQTAYRPGFQVGMLPGAGEAALDGGFLREIIDPKTARMAELYSSQGIALTWEKVRTFLVTLTWLILSYAHQKAKRVFNLLLALSGLPFVFPLMLFTAIAIKLESPGPVIFKQERVGKWGRRFTCYKFRSMYIDAEARKAELADLNEADEVVFKIKNDPRVTRVGRIIRKLSIDELPQIFNVIKGDMNAVGPRPPVPYEVAHYEYDTFLRLDAIPGITGLQQVSGRSDLSFKRWVELDIEYVRDQSLRGDIEIILKTVPAVLSTKGAY